MARTGSLRTQSARHRVDHGTICGRNCANSGHYKALRACVHRIFVNSNSSRRRPEKIRRVCVRGRFSAFLCLVWTRFGDACPTTPPRNSTVRSSSNTCRHARRPRGRPPPRRKAAAPPRSEALAENSVLPSLLWGGPACCVRLKPPLLFVIHRGSRLHCRDHGYNSSIARVRSNRAITARTVKVVAMPTIRSLKFSCS